MPMLNFYFAWAWILVGLVAGAAQGLLFHREGWLGGYGAWPRRTVRLGHIAFLGTAVLNLLFCFSVAALELSGFAVGLAGALLLAGAAAMPVVCYLAAWKKAARLLFPVPVGGLIGGTAALLVAAAGR